MTHTATETSEETACFALIANLEGLLGPGKPGVLQIEAGQTIQRILKSLDPDMVVGRFYSVKNAGDDAVYGGMLIKAMHELLGNSHPDDAAALREAQKLIARAVVPFAAAEARISRDCYDRSAGVRLIEAMKKHYRH